MFEAYINGKYDVVKFLHYNRNEGCPDGEWLVIRKNVLGFEVCEEENECEFINFED